MRVSQRRKDKIQATIEGELKALRGLVAVRDIGKTIPGTGKFFDNQIEYIVAGLKALRRKYWGFTDKQILRLMKLERMGR